MFWSYLWGIEINNRFLFHRFAPSVLILPMRDWNNTIKSTIGSYEWFWSYLWGIEIHWNRWKSRGFIVLILPMRDWNTDGSAQTARQNCVLILPMRDWNVYPILFRKCGHFCFDLTYEGLKYHNTVNFNTILGSFDLTYEGLKLQLKIQSSTPPLNVWILPMRDWNKRNASKLKSLNWVLILPMRDWNNVSSFRNRSVKLFWSYLWGIEKSVALELF